MKSHQYSLLIGFCIPQLALSAQTKRWTQITADENVVIEVDSSLTKADSGRVRAWTRWTWATTKTIEANPPIRYTSTQYRTEFDCATTRSGMVRYAFYNARGDMVGGGATNEHPPLEEPIPESLGEAVVVAVCKAAKERGF